MILRCVRCRRDLPDTDVCPAYDYQRGGPVCGECKFSERTAFTRALTEFAERDAEVSA